MLIRNGSRSAAPSGTEHRVRLPSEALLRMHPHADAICPKPVRHRVNGPACARDIRMRGCMCDRGTDACCRSRPIHSTGSVSRSFRSAAKPLSSNSCMPLPLSHRAASVASSSACSVVCRCASVRPRRCREVASWSARAAQLWCVCVSCRATCPAYLASCPLHRFQYSSSVSIWVRVKRATLLLLGALEATKAPQSGRHRGGVGRSRSKLATLGSTPRSASTQLWPSSRQTRPASPPLGPSISGQTSANSAEAARLSDHSRPPSGE